MTSHIVQKIIDEGKDLFKLFHVWDVDGAYDHMKTIQDWCTHNALCDAEYEEVMGNFHFQDKDRTEES